MNNGYIYYLNDAGRLSDLIVSYESLKETNPKYPVYCILGDCKSTKLTKFLSEIGINPLINTNDSFHIYTKDINGERTGGFDFYGRLDIFKLTQFNKLVLLGADTYIKKNIDELFDFPDGSMATHHDFREEKKHNGGGCNGDVVVLKPDINVWRKTYKIVENGFKTGAMKTYTDQEFLNEYYDFDNHPELHLNYMYNTLCILLNEYKFNPLFDWDSVKIFHFAGLRVTDTTNINCFKNLSGSDDYSLSNKLIKEYLIYYNNIIDSYKCRYPYIPLANAALRILDEEI